MTKELHPSELTKIEAETAYYTARTEAQRYAIADFAKKERESLAEQDEARIYSFYAGVDESTCKQAMAVLSYWARQSEPGEREFTIEVTSGGGSVIDGYALIDTVRDLQARGYVINTVGKGMVASMGAIIFQVGNTRTLGRRAYLMLHAVSAQMAGSIADIEDKHSFAKKLNRQGVELLAERSTMTADAIDKRTERAEWHMDAFEAVDLGFADDLLAEGAYASTVPAV